MNQGKQPVEASQQGRQVDIHKHALTLTHTDTDTDSDIYARQLLQRKWLNETQKERKRKAKRSSP